MPTCWVLDSSAVAAVLLGEPAAEPVAGILGKVGEGQAKIVVPPLLWFEVLNALVMAQRRARVAPAQGDELLARLNDLPMETDSINSPEVRRRIMVMSGRHQLTVYDAAYLELADRLSGRLKTFDRELLALAGTYPWIE